MNNTAVNDFFWISQGKVASVCIQVKWANVQAIDVKYYRDLAH